MAKISALDVIAATDGTESLPIVKGSRTLRIRLAALAQAMVPFLVQWYKGDRGDPGGDAGQVAPFVAAKGLTFKAGINRIRTTGRLADGDGGDAIYDRWTAAMPALVAEQRDISWFEAADGSRWVLSPNQLFFAAQFGGMGGNGIDAGPILRAALAAPMVHTLNLGALTHHFSGEIIKPSGKALIGVSRAASWLKAIPVNDGSQVRPRQCVYAIDDTAGRMADFSLDVQRSGATGNLNQRASGVTIRAKDADGTGTVVERVDVYNATGYAHYDSADYGGALATPRKLRGIIRRDCSAFNSQVGFESTGDVRVKKVDCLSEGYTDTAWDGGAVVNTEAHYHYYGPIGRVDLIRCVSRGKAAAGLLAIVVDNFALGTINALDCDIEVPNAVPACIVKGQVRDGTTYRVGRFRSVNSRWASGNGGATSFEHATISIRGGEFVGGFNAANGGGGGAGIDISTGSVADLYAPDVTGNANPSGTAAAFGLNIQAGSVRWHGGGRITAIGPEGQMIPVSGAVTYAGQPILTPAAGSSLNPVAKTDYPNSFVMARLVSDQGTDRYISTTEILTRDANNRWFLGDAQASGASFGTTPGKVNLLGSGRNLLVASTNGNNYVEVGGQGSGTAYVRGYEGNMQFGNAFGGSLHLCTGATNRWTVQPAGHLAGAADNAYSLGTASLRASVVYAGTGAINTSDERDKAWRGAMTGAEREAARAIVAELGFYRWHASIAEKGEEDARLHFGARAQRVWSIMADHGLVDPIGDDGRPGRTPYAFLCYDEWQDSYEDVMAERFGPPEPDQSMGYMKIGERLVLAAGRRFGLREGQMTLFLLGALLG